MEEQHENDLDMEHKKNAFQERYMDQVRGFVEMNNITPTKLFTAHELALGVKQQDLEAGKETEKNFPLRKEVYELAKKLADFYKEGLAVNRVAELCDDGRTFDRAPDALKNR